METKTIHANGLEFAYYEQGQADKLVICLHGFPDTADTWLGVMPKLADEGFRVIAPFMRGYPPTQIPLDGQYSIKHIAEDTIGLVDAFGADTAILIGHDWGAFAAYAATALAPGRITKLITVAVPHPRAQKTDLKTLWKASHFFFFQIRGMAVNWMKRDNYAAISTLYKRWSPTWQFTEADIEPVRKSLSEAGGVEATLGYYWSFIENRGNKEVQNLVQLKTEVPTLTIIGELDRSLNHDAFSRTEEAFIAPYQQVLLPDNGHFLHREVPEKFAELVLNFLNG